MDKSKKIIAVVVTIAVLICAGLGIYFTISNQYGVDRKADIVLITNGSDIKDDNKTAKLWQGVREYGKENSMKGNYIIPEVQDEKELTNDVIASYIDIAVTNGAKVIVLPDDNFSVAAYELAPTYKDVKFLLFEAFPHSQDDNTMRTISNVISVQFDNQQAGFLAGYNAVMDGYTKLGFIGSIIDDTTGDYVGGFKQGATYASQENDKVVTFDYAEYDSLLLDFDYSMNAKPVYEEISADAYKVNVIGGYGTGYYKEGQNVTLKADDAQKDKVFDHWEIKSDSDDVKAQDIVIDDVNNGTNAVLTVGKGDCTISAVYSDAKTQEVTIYGEGDSAYKTLNVPENTSVKVVAPMFDNFLVFDKWECNFENAIDDKYNRTVEVSVSDKPISLTPKYVLASEPSFKITVDGGEGTGDYYYQDNVNLMAPAPEDGYMFTKWILTDSKGNEISLEDMTNPNLNFEVPNRYDALVEEFYNNGVEVLFSNDEIISNSALKHGKFISCNVNDLVNENCIDSIDYDYALAVKLALGNEENATLFFGNAKNKCIKLSNKSFNPKTVDEKGEEIADENYDEDYALLYTQLAEDKLKLIHLKTGADIRLLAPSDSLELNYWNVYVKQ